MFQDQYRKRRFTENDVDDEAVAEFGFEEEAAALGGRQKKMLREKRKRAKPGTFGAGFHPLFILPCGSHDESSADSLMTLTVWPRCPWIVFKRNGEACAVCQSISRDIKCV